MADISGFQTIAEEEEEEESDEDKNKKYNTEEVERW